MAPMAMRDGAPVELEPMEDGGAYDFPEPIGEASTIYTLHSEVRTFGDELRLRGVQLPPVAWRPPVLERVRGAGGRHATRRSTPPRARRVPSSRADRVRARDRGRGGGRPGDRDGRDPRRMDEWGLGGGIVSTAAPAAAAVRLLARGTIDARGRDAARALRAARGPVPRARAAQLRVRRRDGGERGHDEGRRADGDQARRVPRGAHARPACASWSTTATRCSIQKGAGEGSAIAGRRVRGPGRAHRCPTPSPCSARPRWCWA